jgi:uncharacterized protein (TIGR02145 family)
MLNKLQFFSISDLNLYFCLLFLTNVYMKIRKIVWLFLAIATFPWQLMLAQSTDTIIDTRDGKVYKVVQIGTQVWMAQNLNFEINGSWCFENKTENCEKYGRLYNWEAAKNGCPSGWHLPTDEEWMDLEKFLGMPQVDLTKNNAWRGTDQSKKLMSDSSIGFNLLLGGYRNPPSNYLLLDYQAFFWTSTDQQGSAWFRQMYQGNTQIFRRTRPVSWAFSVRCVKD